MSERLDRCRSCSATIIWLRNDKTGRLAPIDATAAADGPIVRPGIGVYRVLTVVERESDVGLQDHPLRYTNHFQTCPNAARHKRKKQPAVTGHIPE